MRTSRLSNVTPWTRRQSASALELETAAKDVVSGAASGEEAGARIGAALDDLAKSFRDAYGSVDCG